MNQLPGDRFMSDEYTSGSTRERESLDLVQRVIMSLIVGVVIGLISISLGLFLIMGDHPTLTRSDELILWVMCGVIGLVASSVILFLNRRRPYHPLVILGLLPMAVTALWLFHLL